jgi:hypothetical protein
MINEFHAGLLNTVAVNQSPGADFVPLSWRARVDSPEVRNLRAALLLRPDLPVAANWRAIEIRKVIQRSDIKDNMLAFDNRDGHLIGTLQSELATYFSPKMTAKTGAAKISLHGRLKGNYFDILNWRLTTHGTGDMAGQYRIKTPIATIAGTADPGSRVSIASPGHSETQVSFLIADDDTHITWASSPQITLAHTAEQLRGDLRPVVITVASQPSVLAADRRELLARIAGNSKDALSQVAAAAFLLVGCTLTAPEVSSPMVTV